MKDQCKWCMKRIWAREYGDTPFCSHKCEQTYLEEEGEYLYQKQKDKRMEEEYDRETSK